MTMKTVLLAMASLAVIASCGSDHHPPGGEGGGDSGGSDDGDGSEADAGNEGPDAAPGAVIAADACEQIALDWCESTIVCELYTPEPGQDTVPGCTAVQEPYCLARRAEPVPSEDLTACLSAIAEQACGATMIIPGRCRVLWDTIVPDAGVEVDAGGDPDAGIDAGLPDAG